MPVRVFTNVQLRTIDLFGSILGRRLSDSEGRYVIKKMIIYSRRDPNLDDPEFFEMTQRIIKKLDYHK
ncbi:MAG TPA: hypothetical protein VIY08_16230 [Candidatus Nitrosocosmicus sp.]